MCLTRRSDLPILRRMNRILRFLALGAAVWAATPTEEALAGGFFDRTRFGLGADLGYQTLIGSNGKAFGMAPVIRVQGEVHPNDAYVVQLIYGFASHGLKDPGGLFPSGSSSADWYGEMDMHYANLGFKAFTDVGPQDWQWFRPFMSSSVGIVYTASTVGSESVTSIYATSGRALFDMDVAMGLDLNLRIVSVGVFGRAGFIPKFGGQIRDQITLATTWPLSFGITASIAI